MTDHAGISMETVAAGLVAAPAHYVDAVSDMAGRHEVHAAHDIVSASGIKLVARGARIGADLQRKLAGHRLSGLSLEESLLISASITPDTLARDIGALVDSDPWFQRLATRSGDPLVLRHGAARLALPREVLFRLTVAREQRRALYDHLLGVALISHYLALRSDLAPPKVDAIVVAAL
jgi:hypothetical protein